MEVLQLRHGIVATKETLEDRGSIWMVPAWLLLLLRIPKDRPVGGSPRR